MADVAEFAGYLAAVLVFLTFYMKTMIPLRVVGICSNCAFIAYGYLGGLYPVLILHVILLPLNAIRLREMVRLTRQVRAAAQSDLKTDWLKPFTTSHRTQAGEVLFRKGDPANAMFVVVSGRYRVAELGLDIAPGEMIGELALLAPDQSRTQTVECSESGELLQITYEQVMQLYYQNPTFGFYLLRLSTERLFANNLKLERELVALKTAGVPETPG
jgi:CRP/FNR family transcriptional regulator, cyclic AMP receptor protein